MLPAGLRTIQHARTIMRINDMYVHGKKPSIWVSNDGTVQNYVRYKNNYNIPDKTMKSWIRSSTQLEVILKDIEKCSVDFPGQYVSLVGECPTYGTVDSLYLCFSPRYLPPPS
jgi:hypothetical protein